MRVTIYHCKGYQKGDEWLQLFAHGLRRHSVRFRWEHFNIPTDDTDISVIWGVRADRVIRAQRMKNALVLVGELAYFGERVNQFCSLGFNGLNNRAVFPRSNGDGGRWRLHGVPVVPWKENGEYIVFAGQILNDRSLAVLKRPAIFYQRIYQKLCDSNMGNIVFRPHPAAPRKFAPRGAILDVAPSIEMSLSKAKGLITFNSNAAVDAILNGVPSCVCDRGSMAWSVSAHWKNPPFDFIRPDRTQWLNDLAYCQWTPQEIESGLAWEHLKPLAEKLLQAI